MPSASEVTPQKWDGIEILYDDGEYSVIIGNFEGNRCLGERWNGSESEPGYPNQGRNSLWLVVNPHFNLPILHKILDLHLKNSSQSNTEYTASTINALKRFS